MKRIRTWCTLLLGALFLLVLAAAPAKAEQSGLQVNAHTQEEIRAYAQEHLLYEHTPVYEEEPVLEAPFAAGTLSAQTRAEAFSMLNFVRFVAGLDPVEEDADYTRMAQAGCLVDAVLNQLTHTPAQPEGMSDELYQLGYSGTSQSNLAMGYRNLPRAIYAGWMEDSDSTNIDRVGHRRWILNPKMGKTGFGEVGSYTAMYDFDRSNSSALQKYVAWPAQQMPTVLFGKKYAWSLSVGSTVDISQVEVTLTRRSDSAVWHFSESETNAYFNVDNGGYGETGCIIFLPGGDFTCQAGDIYDVCVTGALDHEICYSVEFFDMDDLFFEPAYLTLTAESNTLDPVCHTETLLHYSWACGSHAGNVNWSYPSFIDLSIESANTVRISAREGMYGEGQITASLRDMNIGETIAQVSVPIKVYRLAGQPVLISGTIVSDGIRITWEQPDPFPAGYRYEVLRRTEQSDFEPIAVTDQLSWTDTAAEYKTPYIYTVRCCAEDGQYVTSFYDEEGLCVTRYKDGWNKIGGSWYYYKNGVPQTGWVKVSGQWYYMNAAGVMQTGWQKISGKWYYLKDSGAMVTGWKQIKNVWYFFKPSGVMAAKEWYNGYYLNANGSWTYQYKASWKQNAYGWWFGDTSGWYAKSCTITINDKQYTFDAKGYWVK